MWMVRDTHGAIVGCYYVAKNAYATGMNVRQIFRYYEHFGPVSIYGVFGLMK